MTGKASHSEGTPPAHLPEIVCAEDETRENWMPSGETMLQTSP